MKRKTTFLACCMLMCMSLANADNGLRGGRTDRFPDRAPTVKNALANNVVREGLNDDKDLGVKMWATTVTDYNNDPGFVYFYSNNTSELKKTGLIKSREEDEHRRWTMSGGTYHNGEYLGYFYYRYDFGINYVKAFASIDLEKGTWVTKKDMSDMQDDWDFIEAMYTNPTTGKLMGLARNRDGSITSTLGEIDPETGEYTQLAALDKYYFSIAYDAYGTLWAVRWNAGSDDQVNGARLVTLNPNDGYKEDKVVRLKKDGSDFKIYFQNSIYFDVSTGDLWIVASNNEGKQYLCMVDTLTGEMESKGRVGFADIVTGLYIPGYKPDSFEAASRVTEISSEFDDNGIVTLKWKNPVTAWNKQPLAELAEILIYRDGMEDDKLVTTITENVTVGGNMSWTDNGAGQGVHVYYIVPCRVTGEKGVPETWRAFSGRDVPGQVKNVTLTKNNNMSLTLRWEQPSLGKNDGWYDKTNVKYDIKRYPDKKNVATGITETMFTDNELGSMGSYYYTIRAYTNDGEGLETESPAVMAGSAYEIPYSTEFATKAEADQWEKIDANGDGRIFFYKDYMEPWGLYLSSSESGNDDYAISPALKLKAGKTYKVTFKVFFNHCTTDLDPDRAQTFSITAGRGATAEAQNIELKKWDKFQHFKYGETFEFEAFFTPESDGDYNVSYHYFDSPVYDDITIASASIEEVFAKDLAAMSVKGNSVAVKDTPSEYTVKVKNMGGNAVNSYKVQVARFDANNHVVLGETTVNNTIEPQAETDVTVNVTSDVEGEIQLAGVVILEGDQYADNNVSETIKVYVEPAGTKPFNKEITGENSGVYTRIPVSFTKIYSHSQSIYKASELSGVNKIYRLAFEYNGNAESSTPLQDIEFDVILYLGMSDKAAYDKQNVEWEPLVNQTKVYEGKLGLMAGENNMLVFNFNEPFDYDNTKNLVVTVLKKSQKYQELFPAFFKIYNDNWDADEYRTILYDNNNTQEAEEGNGFGNPCLPVLHLAVDEISTGVRDVVIGGGISYDGATINFGGIDAASVAVYDLMGRMVLNNNVSEGTTTVNAYLRQGAYVIKVTDRKGRVYITKMCVAK